MVAPKSKHDYPDDIFAETRMSFGEHIEELRTRLIRALLALLACLVVGFILDAIGESVGNKKIGIGRPMLAVIAAPVETQVRDFYYRRQVAQNPKLSDLSQHRGSPERLQEIQEKLRKNNESLSSLTEEERLILRASMEEMPIVLDMGPIADAMRFPREQLAHKEVMITAKVSAAYISVASNKGDALLGSKQYLTTLSAQEAFLVYFKVSVICGLVIASPIILYQFWAFIGAGLYPHEKRYVSILFWPSVILFVAGVLLCQFLVLPGAVKALLAFNEFLGLDPDIRLNEWLGLALILPLVFGVSFQTPLVMIAMNRMGMFTARDYMNKWRHACFIMAIFAAILTPTPDLITMLYMFVPMFGLYMLGIAFCYYFPARRPEEEEARAEEVAV